VSMGFVFLWAFLDKTFGLHYSTPSWKAWIHGGSPTNGFLKSVDVGPLQSWFHSIAGTWWADWLFMLGLLGVGLTLILGVLMYAGTAAGVLLLGFMWLAELPLAQHTSAGVASGSTKSVRRLPLHLRRSPRGARPHWCGADVGSGPDVGGAAGYSSPPMVALSSAR